MESNQLGQENYLLASSYNKMQQQSQNSNQNKNLAQFQTINSQLMNNQYGASTNLSIIEEDVASNTNTNSKVEGGQCHGCGHPGHSRPTCPFKDMPGWVAKGKRVQPLDIYQTAPPVTNVGVCHGCGHFGHSRVVCPYKDLPGWFHYGQRRVPLDISAKNINSNAQSVMEICQNCGSAGHNRNQCPSLNKEILRIQRPVDINPSNPNVYITSNDNLTNQIPESPNTALDSEFSSGYAMQSIQSDIKCVPLIQAICQSSLNPNESFQVMVMLDPTKPVNLISKKLFDLICLSGDTAISRKDVNIQLHDRTLPLTYYSKLQLAIIEMNFEVEDEFYITDSVIDIILGYSLIFSNNLLQLLHNKSNVIKNNKNISLMNPQQSVPTSNSQIQEASSAPTPPSVMSGPAPSNNYTKNNVPNNSANQSNSFISNSSVPTYSNMTNTTTFSYPYNNDLNDSSLWYSGNASNYDMKSDDISGFSHLNVNDSSNLKR